MLFSLIDLQYARYSHMKKLRMSFQEVKNEAKENEGDPHMKHARRMRAQEIANSNVLRDVAKADVIIVNPTHYAVALEWSRDTGAVPVCVAKGVDEGDAYKRACKPSMTYPFTLIRLVRALYMP